MLPAPGLKIQGAAQRNDELTNRSSVPIEISPRGRLLKRDCRGRQLSTQYVPMRAVIEADHALLEVRIVVIPGPNAHASDHCPSLWFSARDVVVVLLLFMSGRATRHSTG
jgi:hypothetical protein